MAVIRATSRSVLAGLVVVGGLVLAGCGAGQHAQTAEQQPTIDGVNAQVGDLAIRNAALEYPADGVYDQGSSARLRMVVVNQGTGSDTLVSVSSPVAGDVTITDRSAAATGTATPVPSVSTSAEATPTDTASPSGSATPSGTASASPGDTASGSASPSGTDTASGTPSAGPTASSTPASARIAIPPNAYVPFTGDGPHIELTGLTSKLYPGQNLKVTVTFATAGPVTMTIAVGTPEAEVAPAPTVSVEPDSEDEG